MDPYRPMPAWVDDLVGEATVGCCMDGDWRGRMCHYHRGLADGVEALWAALDRLGLSISQTYRIIRGQAWSHVA